MHICYIIRNLLVLLRKWSYQIKIGSSESTVPNGLRHTIATDERQLESRDFEKFLYLADFKLIWAKNLLELNEALILSK